MPQTVPTELVLIVDSDRIQTSVIYAVSGHCSLYSYSVINFPNITAYTWTSITINQQSLLMHFLLSLSLYLYLMFLGSILDSYSRTFAWPSTSHAPTTKLSKFNKTVAKVYTKTFIHSQYVMSEYKLQYMTMNNVRIELTLKLKKYSNFHGLISTKSATNICSFI